MSPQSEDEHQAFWHSMNEKEVISALETGRKGLTEEEAAKRQESYGKNILPGKKAVTIFQVILHQLLSPFIYILIAAGVVSISISERADAIFIILVILLNAVLGTVQEWKAEQSASTLQGFLRARCRVKRDGQVKEIDAEEVVPGDIVLLESGEKVSADIRLLKASHLMLDEAFLTGESLPVEKGTDPVSAEMAVAERTGMAFAGSIVTSGRGEGMVVATGEHTEIGNIAREVSGAKISKTPLVIRMDEFVKKITFAILAASAVLSVVAITRGIPYSEVFFMAVALAVSAIPEGLPVSMTVALSISTTRMARRKVIVRKLAAVEGLGSCTCICTDKTGTLTMNEQTVKMVVLPSGDRYAVTGEGYGGDGEIQPEEETSDEEHIELLKRIATAGVLVNEGSLVKENGEWSYRGDTVDVALLSFAYKAGVDPDTIRSEVEKVGEIPFESERRFAAMFYRKDSTARVAVKGAVETLLPRCNRALSLDGEKDVDEEAINKLVNQLGNEGYRVIAVAEGEINDAPSNEEEEAIDSLPSLVLLGLVAMIDPLRPEAKDAVEKCHRAGVEVVMITGDHAGTALAIAREIGIAETEDEVLTGNDLEKLGSPDSREFAEKIAKGRVFARVTPMQKLYIVEAKMRNGHLVAVTGDGVNDAPAMQKANLGVAMGSGTDVAKDVSELIVTDDNFASIEAGIEEGRFAYANIRKVIYLLVSTGTAEVVLFTLAILFGLPIPLLAVQILWLNLVTNGIQDKALVFEPGEPGTMEQPPRKPDEGIFDRAMIRQILVSGVYIGIVTLVGWWLFQRAGWDEHSARNSLLLLMVLFQNFHLFNCRSETTSIFRMALRTNLFLFFGAIAAQVIHLVSMHSETMQGVLSISPVSFLHWITLLLVASTIVLVMEASKAIVRKKTI